VEYTAVRVGRGLAALAHGAAWALLTLLAVVLRPAVRAADSFKTALTHPRQLAGYAVPLLAAGVLAWFVRTTLARPFVLRVEVGGQVLHVDSIVGAEGGLGEADAVGGHTLLGGRGNGKDDFIVIAGFFAGLGQLQGLRSLGVKGLELGHGQGGGDGESGFVNFDSRHNVCPFFGV